MVNIKPLHNRVLLEMIEEPDTVNGGVIQIMESSKEAPQKAKVLAVASDVEIVQVGQTVLIGKYSGTTIKYDGVPYTMINSKDIMAVLEED